MRFEKSILVFGLATSLVAPACGSILQTPDGGADGGGGRDGGPAACRTLDEATCRTRADCTVAGCSPCGGVQTFAGCYDPAHEAPPICGTLIACPAPCSILDEASCRQRTDCVAQVCPNCNGGSSFVGCSTLTDAIIACPAIACPLPCGQVTTKDACETRPDCHSVFVDPRNCACAAIGCCAQFSRCADGDKATCKAPSGAACASTPPYCEGPYVVSYTATCFEGCVQSADCAN